MTVFSTIQNCKIPTECINEGMCASMGSIIWSAGNKSLMRDYAILMIHSPFLPGKNDDPTSDLVNAFANQIKTIYRKRFGLTKEKVDAIMKGETGKDGTFFTSQEAVKAGIIPAENIIHTSKQLCEKVKNEISELEEAEEIQSALYRVCAEFDMGKIENKLSKNNPSILNQNQQTMSEEKNYLKEYSAVTATLGLTDSIEAKDVTARIRELLNAESALNQSQKDLGDAQAVLNETKKELSDAQTVIAGKDATIQNLEKEANDMSASLKTYKDKEEAEQKAYIENVVNQAVEDGKIEPEAKAHWVSMAEANLELAEATLNSIPKREQISKEIANDPANVQAASEAVKTADEKMTEKVQAVVGKDFEFKKISH